MLWRDNLCIMLKQTEQHEAIVPNWKVEDKLWDAYFWVDDTDTLYAEFEAAGAKMDYGPCDQPYGCREFGIQDLDGHEIAFGQDIESHPQES